MELKTCKRCNLEKLILDYHLKKGVKSGLTARCKACVAEVKKIKKLENPEREKTWSLNSRIRNAAAIKKRHKEWREKNKAYVHEKMKNWYYLNREYSIKKACEWSKNNKEKRNIRNKKRAKERRKEDSLYKLKSNLRARIYFILKFNRLNKEESSRNILGASYLTVKKHLEKQFKKGMTWDNYGEWHVDHVIPFKTAKTEDDIMNLCHYTNLQPMWGKENMSKGGKLKESIQIKMTI
jgi:hypothetical protein